MALQRVRIPSPNYSNRGGSSVRLIVCHTAEGARTYQDLGAFFANPASGVSSHTGIDDTPGVVGEYVQRSGKAWTAAGANPVATQTELCGFAAWSPQEWANHEAMLDNLAQWIAEEAQYFDLPITRLTPSQAQGGGRGVCQHIDLGSWGGGHVDCDYGTGDFPFDAVLATARQYAAGGKPQPEPPTPEPAQGGDNNMLLQDPKTGGYWVATPEGGVHALAGAPYLGGTNNKEMNAKGYPCVGIARLVDAQQSEGYTLCLDYGPEGGKDGRFRIYRFPRNGSSIVK